METIPDTRYQHILPVPRVEVMFVVFIHVVCMQTSCSLVVLCTGLKYDLTSVSSRDFSSMWSAALPYTTHRGSRAPTPLMMQHRGAGGFGRLQRRYSESGNISVPVPVLSAFCSNCNVVFIVDVVFCVKRGGVLTLGEHSVFSYQTF